MWLCTYRESEPTAVAVKRGTVQVFTQSMLHSAWPNTDTEPRKGFILAWSAAEVSVGFVQNRCDGVGAPHPPPSLCFQGCF